MKDRRFYLVLVSLVAVALLLASACAPKATPAPTPVPTTPAPAPATPAPKAAPTPAAFTPAATPTPGPAPAKPAWQAEWEKAIELGKKEGKVVIYANIGKDETTAMRKVLKDRYGIEVEVVTGRGSAIAEKVLSERRAGLYLVDLFIAGAPNCLQLKAGGATATLRPSLLLPEVTDPKLWYEGKLPFLDKAEHVFCFRADIQPPFFINTNLVKEGEITSFKDLLNPKWKGKIVVNDPTTFGSSNDIFMMVSEYLYGLDYWRQFAKQEPLLTRDQRLPVEWVARGKSAVAIGSKKDVQAEFIRAGAPVKSALATEGEMITIGANNIVLLDKAPHPDAAKVFINWLLGKEEQTMLSKTQLSQSARTDVPTDHLDSIYTRKPGAKYFPMQTEELMPLRGKYTKLAEEVFAEQLK